MNIHCDPDVVLHFSFVFVCSALKEIGSLLSPCQHSGLRHSFFLCVFANHNTSRACCLSSHPFCIKLIIIWKYFLVKQGSGARNESLHAIDYIVHGYHFAWSLIFKWRIGMLWGESCFLFHYWLQLWRPQNKSYNLPQTVRRFVFVKLIVVIFTQTTIFFSCT